MSKENKMITLIIGETEINFEPNMVAYNSMINDMAMDNKIVPIVSYLRRIVQPASKAALDELLLIPGAAMQIVEKVNSEYAPKLDIEIKN
ncbi:putative phage tail assembly chaperone [Xenorhabdus nematophila]|uniref:Putative phage protein n=2 Tax=Xenorhabdus bovienii TaxID=40576 RepID=A0A077QIY7_XENBV|nr:putative phage tail assembly chaperone [Xenorhabdus bovienii]MCG3462021.1 putative phage tail assembly chaperone [Xenorhabdus bovienii]CBJ80151.1 putative phage gene [Xenorhabdus bovienii SS-2004]CDH29863.1 putative phage gene [Xenorhabdus bovienii str. Jollieti]CDH32341.1 putative phage gene [Xenorhabdus bovienii str. Intermedium]